MEIFDLFDENRLPLNKTMVRGTQMPENSYRMVVHCVILNSTGNKMLIQKRLATKNPYPGLWDVSCGGSAIKGEISSQAIHRELLEELGFDYNFSKIRPVFTFNFVQGFNDFYVIMQDVDIKTLKLQQTEVECVKWATKEEILNLIDNNKFIPYKKTLIEFIFDVKNNLSILNK